MSTDRLSRQVTKTEELHTNPRCDRCSSPMVFVNLGQPEYPDASAYKECVGSAQLSLQGHYAGFIDMEVLVADLCETCCSDLLEFLGIERAMWDDPERSQLWKGNF